LNANGNPDFDITKKLIELNPNLNDKPIKDIVKFKIVYNINLGLIVKNIGVSGGGTPIFDDAQVD